MRRPQTEMPCHTRAGFFELSQKITEQGLPARSEVGPQLVLLGDQDVA